MNNLENKSKCAFGTFVYPMVLYLNRYVIVFVCRKTKRTLAGKDAIIDIDISSFSHTRCNQQLSLFANLIRYNLTINFSHLKFKLNLEIET